MTLHLTIPTFCNFFRKAEGPSKCIDKVCVNEEDLDKPRHSDPKSIIQFKNQAISEYFQCLVNNFQIALKMFNIWGPVQNILNIGLNVTFSSKMTFLLRSKTVWIGPKQFKLVLNRLDLSKIV